MTIPHKQVASAQRAKSDEVSIAQSAKSDADRIAETIPAPQYDPRGAGDLRAELADAIHDRDEFRRVTEEMRAEIARLDDLRLKHKSRAAGFESELTNARALADKLQHLLTSKTHECESLRAHACDGGCKPNMETVPLPDLIRHVALFLDDGQSLTIYSGDEIASVQAFGKSFVCNYGEVNDVLDASAMLARLEAV